MSRRSILPLLCLPVLLGCGDPVTNPLHGGFEHDPAPILGTWHMVGEDGTLDPRYTFEIHRAGDYLFGEVRYRMFSRDWQMSFDVVRSWDGTGFHFHSDETHGLSVDSLRWHVGYQPRVELGCPPGWEGDRADRPAFLLLSGPRSLTYRRPGTTVDEDPGCRPPGSGG